MQHKRTTAWQNEIVSKSLYHCLLGLGEGMESFHLHNGCFGIDLLTSPSKPSPHLFRGRTFYNFHQRQGTNIDSESYHLPQRPGEDRCHMNLGATQTRFVFSKNSWGKGGTLHRMSFLKTSTVVNWFLSLARNFGEASQKTQMLIRTFPKTSGTIIYIYIFHYVLFFALLSSSISTCLCYIYRVSCIYKGTSSQLKVCYENPRHSMMSSQIIAALMIDGPESLISVFDY